MDVCSYSAQMHTSYRLTSQVRVTQAVVSVWTNPSNAPTAILYHDRSLFGNQYSLSYSYRNHHIYYTDTDKCVTVLLRNFMAFAERGDRHK